MIALLESVLDGTVNAPAREEESNDPVLEAADAWAAAATEREDDPNTTLLVPNEVEDTDEPGTREAGEGAIRRLSAS